jgi:LL-diaminopimelate aminotransferase
MALNIEFSDRLKNLPPYLFVEIDKAKREAVAQGRDVINLGIGDPDYPTPQHIVDAMKKAIEDGNNHHYALDAGLPALRKEIATWFKQRFQVDLNPDNEIYPLIGSKEGLAHLPLGIINPKDKVILTDPAYPAYRPSIEFAGGEIIPVPLTEEEGFVPDLKKIAQINNAKMLVINYPNNPTAATATKDFYKKLISLAHDKGLILVSDMAYSEVYYDGKKPVSILEIDGAKEVAIEFHSFSKTFYMTGWRLGWACGNPKLIAALGKVKTNFDSGIFQAIQVAGITAIQSKPEVAEAMRQLYQERRDFFVGGLNKIGWKVTPPQATYYVWAKIPKGFKDSMQTSKAFLDKADIVATPGIGFGKPGEGFIRMTLTVPQERLSQAIDRLKKIL